MVNEAIGGNMVVAVRPAPGCTLCDGARAFIRLDRDVFGQAGVRTVVWLEGINDIGGADATAAQVIEGMKTVISRVHARGLRIIGATLTPSFRDGVLRLRHRADECAAEPGQRLHPPSEPPGVHRQREHAIGPSPVPAPAEPVEEPE